MIRRWAASTLILVAACSDQAAIAPPPAPLGFTDVAAEVGIDAVHGAFAWEPSADPAAMTGGGVCWLDYDGDGWLDLFVVNNYAEAEWGRWQEAGGTPTSRLYRNRGGTFSDVTDTAGLDLPLRGQGCVAADLDGDGAVDLYVTTARADVLLWNEGNGTFSDGTESSGIDVFGWHGGAAAGDVNGDGLLDLFVAGYVDPNTPSPEGAGFPAQFAARPDLLYLNTGRHEAGHAGFREVGAIAGLEADGHEHGLGAILSDLDGDGDLDLFVANDGDPNRLYRNDALPDDPEGIGMRFVDVTGTAGVGDTKSGMGVAAEDYDRDGAYDLLVTNLGEQGHSLYRNDLAFRFAAEAQLLAGLGAGDTGWGVSWADFDLDGDHDLMIANGFVPIRGDADRQSVTYLERTDTAFADRSELAGALGPLHGRGLAAADYDNDGDIDVAIASVSDPVILLRNDVSGPAWLTVDAGTTPGTVINVTFDDGRRHRCEVRAGASFLSSEDPRCHLGLADATVESVDVQWPDGATREVNAPSPNRILTIRP